MADLVPCRWCDRPIRWVRTAAGKPMPLDPQPKPFDPPQELMPNVVVDEGAGICRVLTRAEVLPAHVTRWLTHWATCPYSRKVRAATARRRSERATAAASPAGEGAAR